MDDGTDPIDIEIDRRMTTAVTPPTGMKIDCEIRGGQCHHVISACGCKIHRRMRLEVSSLKISRIERIECITVHEVDLHVGHFFCSTFCIQRFDDRCGLKYFS